MARKAAKCCCTGLFTKFNTVTFRSRSNYCGQGWFNHGTALSYCAGYDPFDNGETICADTAMEPADSPAMVTRFGSPPKASILACTQRRAAF
jgi:hypothetical protein